MCVDLNHTIIYLFLTNVVEKEQKIFRTFKLVICGESDATYGCGNQIHIDIFHPFLKCFARKRKCELISLVRKVRANIRNYYFIAKKYTIFHSNHAKKQV